jgi:hypothetical protein
MRLLALPILLFAVSTAGADPTANSDPATDVGAIGPSAARWLAVGVTSEAKHYDAARGVRADLDLANLDGWIVGATAGYAQAVVDVYGDLIASLHTRDLRALGYVARAATFRRWELRGSFGVGAIRTTASAEAFNGPRMAWVEDGGVFPVAEATVRATVPISPRWAVTTGAVVTYLDQYFHLDGGTTHREAELVFQLGLALRR